MNSLYMLFVNKWGGLIRRVIVGTEGSGEKWFYLRVVFYNAA